MKQLTIAFCETFWKVSLSNFFFITFITFFTRHHLVLSLMAEFELHSCVYRITCRKFVKDLFKELRLWDPEMTLSLTIVPYLKRIRFCWNSRVTRRVVDVPWFHSWGSAAQVIHRGELDNTNEFIVNAVDGVLLMLCAVQPISIKLILLVTRLLVEN